MNPKAPKPTMRQTEQKLSDEERQLLITQAAKRATRKAHPGNQEVIPPAQLLRNPKRGDKIIIGNAIWQVVGIYPKVKQITLKQIG